MSKNRIQIPVLRFDFFNWYLLFGLLQYSCSRLTALSIFILDRNTFRSIGIDDQFLLHFLSYVHACIEGRSVEQNASRLYVRRTHHIYDSKQITSTKVNKTCNTVNESAHVDM